MTSTPAATLSWNALAQPVKVNSTAAIYDALGRMVEMGDSTVPSATSDSGTLSVTVSVVATICSASVNYGADSTAAQLAASLGSQLSSGCSGFASATVSGGAITFTNLYNQYWTYNIQTSGGSNAGFSPASFSVTSSAPTVAGGSYVTITVSGTEQWTTTMPTCTGCKEFVYRPNGTQLAVYQMGQGLVKGTIPLPGGSTAVYNASGVNFIRHKDWLGSSRLATTWAHAVFSKEAYAPFGETYNEAGTPDRSFTGQDQNVVTGYLGTGVYDFLFRKYDPSAGRWLSPDPYGWGAVDQTTPQSMNRYAYAMNNPLALIDPYGLDGCVSPGDDDDCDSDDADDDPGEGGAGYGGDDGDPYGYGAPVLKPGNQRPPQKSNPCDGPYDTSPQCSAYWLGFQNICGPSGICNGGPPYGIITYMTAGGSGGRGGGNNCSVLNSNCKKMGPVQKYIGFLTCEAGITIHDVGDADPASTVTIVAGGVALKSTLAFMSGASRFLPGVNLVVLAVNAAMLDIESVKANQACTAAMYGN